MGLGVSWLRFALFELRVSGSGLNMGERSRVLGSKSKAIASRFGLRVASECAERVVGIFSLPLLLLLLVTQV